MDSQYGTDVDQVPSIRTHWPWVPLARRQAVRTSAAAASALCLLVLFGWFTGQDLLTRLVPGLPSMKVNTALALLLLSVSAWRAAGGPTRVPLIGAPVAMGLASLTLLQPLLGVDFGVDQALLRDLGTPPGDHPGRMSVMTSVAAILLGGSLWLIHHRPDSAALARRLPVLLALGIGYLASVGFLVGVQWDGWLGAVMGSLSLPTATVVLLLGAAVIRLGAAPGPRDPLASGRVFSRAGVRLAMTLLPAALFLPAAIAWAREVLVRQGVLQPDDGQALAFAVLGLLFGLLALASAGWVSRLEQSLREAHDHLEQRVLQRTAQLRDAEVRAEQHRLRLAAVLQYADAAIITVDAGHRIQVFNQAAERMFGHRADTVIGGPLDPLLPPAARDAHRASVSAFATQDVRTRPMGLPGRRLTALRASGEVFPIEAAVSRSGDGDQQMMTVVLRDLGAAQALEDERRARAAAEARLLARVEQQAVVSHELRTPLNAVIGFSDLLLADKDRPLDARQRDFVQLLHKAGRHMLRVIGDLTELSLVEAGRAQLQIASIDAAAALREAAALVAADARTAEVSVTVDADAPAPVRADPRRLQQVILNLAGNAIKYNRPGGWVRLRIEPADDPAQRLLVIEDNGIGLTPQQQARVFEPFNRVGREKGKTEGAGLGLALVRSLAQAMGGAVEVRSTPGQGSRFSVCLPAA